MKRTTTIHFEEGDKIYVIDSRNKEREIVEIVLNKEDIIESGFYDGYLEIAPKAVLRSGSISLEEGYNFDYAFLREVRVGRDGYGFMVPIVKYYKNYDVKVFIDKEDALEYLSKSKN